MYLGDNVFKPDFSFDDLFSVQFWIRKRNAAYVAAIAVAPIAFAALNACSLSPSLAAAVSVVATLGALVGWFIWRELYWRSGKGSRIGIVIFGHKVTRDEVTRTYEHFLALTADIPSLGPFSLRFFTVPQFETDDRTAATMRRYGLCVAAKVVVSPRTDNSAHIANDYSARTETNAAINQALWNVSTHPAVAIISTPPSSQSQHEEAVHRASTLFELLLLVLGTREVNAGNFRRAVSLFEHLDAKLSKRHHAISTPPRYHVRLLERACRCQLLFVPPDLIPTGPTAEGWLADVKTLASRFGKENPEVLAACARAAFLAGHADLAKSYCTTIATSQNQHLRTYGLLGRGAISLLTDDLDDAFSYYKKFLKEASLSNFNWDDIIVFADHAFKVGYKNAVFIQFLYRRIYNNGTLDPALHNSAVAWCSQKPGRRRFLSLLSDFSPTQRQAPRPKIYLDPAGKHPLVPD